MNKTDAESLLRCHRAGREPGRRVRKALRLAEGDAELGKMLRAQTEFDAQITEVIHHLNPPENLRAKLGALHEGAAGGGRGLRSHLGTPAILAALAGVLLIVGIIVFFVMESMANFPGREAVERMLEMTSKLSGTEFEPVKTTTTQLGDWLLLRGYEGYEAPPELADVPVVVARVFSQDDKKIAQYVVEQQESVVYEFHAADFGVQLPADGDWRILEKNGWVAAVRQSGDHCLMISFRGSAAEMRTFLESLAKK